MATLDEAHEQLQTWIGEIDQRIEGLVLQRRAMAATLAALGHGHLPDRTAEAVVVEYVPDPPTPPAPAKPLPKGMPARLKRKKQAPSRPGESKYDYAEVARIAGAANRAGLSMSGAVADRFHVSQAMGSFLVVEARRRGHHVPAGRVAKAKPEVEPGNVVPAGRVAKAKPEVEPGNVTPIVPAAPRAFTLDDTLKILEGGSSVG